MKDIIKGAERSKTIWFAAFVVVFGFLNENITQLKSFFGDNYGLVFVLVGAVNILLRIYTSTSLADKVVKKVEDGERISDV